MSNGAFSIEDRTEGLLERLDAEPQVERVWRQAQGAPTNDHGVDSAYRAELVLDAPQPATERVTHPKFGVGTSERSSESRRGPARFLFDSGERKKLKREYVKAVGGKTG